MNEETYYYPKWDDSLKLSAEEMIEYLLNENDKLVTENHQLAYKIDEIQEIVKHHKSRIRV